ncbi:MAG TPA: hypothetical protein VNO33_01845 [Kofleriaceae bacterium]|nr:hypothetical protein [Kofleriaceae bacterium]
MPPKPPDFRFLFHGEVVAFGARLSQPHRRQVRGAVALPNVGGRANVNADPPDLGGLVRYDSASSSVSGESYEYKRDKGSETEYETRATASMEGLELGDFLRVDFMSTVLKVVYVDRHRFHEESVMLRGLWVQGKGDIPVQNSRMLTAVRDCPTYEALESRVKDKNLLAQNLVCAGTPKDSGQVLVTRSEDFVCYLFEPHFIEFETDTTKYQVFLGEYRVSRRQRRLTMMRIEARPLGSGSQRMMAAPAPGPRPVDPPPPPDPEGDTTVYLDLVMNGSTHP